MSTTTYSQTVKSAAKVLSMALVAFVSTLFMSSCSSDSDSDNTPTTQTFDCSVTFDGCSANTGADAAAALNTYFRDLIGSDGQLSVTSTSESAITMTLTCPTANTESVKSALLFDADKKDLSKQLEDVKGLKDLSVNVKYVGTSMFEYKYATLHYSPIGLWQVKDANTLLFVSDATDTNGKYLSSLLYNKGAYNGTTEWHNNVAQFTSDDKSVSILIFFTNRDGNSMLGTVTQDGQVKDADVKFELAYAPGEQFCIFSAKVYDPDNLMTEYIDDVQKELDKIYFEDKFGGSAKELARLFAHSANCGLAIEAIYHSVLSKHPELKDSHDYIEYVQYSLTVVSQQETITHVYSYFNGEVKNEVEKNY